MSKAEHSKKEEVVNTEPKERETCGIIMPISGNDGYTAEHWNDVRCILEEVISDIGYIPNLVSDADEIGIIHNRIVTNIYNNPIVVCDVSSKNPNVMFELGLRLAFDKATIIIKDDATNYNFDTSPIEHLTYRRDLRYTDINTFKIKLKNKLLSTIKASEDTSYSTFLKNFIQYKPKLETQEISTDKYIIKQFEEINRQLNSLRSHLQMQNELVPSSSLSKPRPSNDSFNVSLSIEPSELDIFSSLIKKYNKYLTINLGLMETNRIIYHISFIDAFMFSEFCNELEKNQIRIIKTGV